MSDFLLSQHRALIKNQSTGDHQNKCYNQTDGFQFTFQHKIFMYATAHPFQRTGHSFKASNKEIYSAINGAVD